MNDQWLYRRGEDVVGPLPLAELFLLLENGTLPPDIEVWAIGSSDAWMPADRREDLRSYRRALGTSARTIDSPSWTRLVDPPRSKSRDMLIALVGLAFVGLAGFFGAPLLLEGVGSPCEAMWSAIGRGFARLEAGMEAPNTTMTFDQLLNESINSPSWWVCTKAYWDIRF